jgi:para-nitrobenzyl esterase
MTIPTRRILVGALASLALGCHGAGSQGSLPADGRTAGDGPAPPDGQAVDPTLVTVAQGVLHGAIASDGTSYVWRGVPYATPPVGALRWKPPAPLAAWSGVRDATQWGNACVQPPSEIAPGGPATGAEDCLYLNVWAPAGYVGQSLPVIFFIHGGAWITGAGSSPVYNGLYLAAHAPAVVVTINYRLGALGFLALAALAAEDPDHTTGNYGLLDQRAALQWVRDNIRAFGGDPTRVTIWGHSAGASSVLMQMASPLSHGLFAGAFAESGDAVARPLASAESVGAQFATGLGCSGASLLSCMRAVDASQFYVPPPSGRWKPALDGYVLSEQPIVTFQAGRQSQVPVIIGVNATEPQNPSAATAPAVTTIVTEADYEAAITYNYGQASQPAILAQYPASSYATPADAYLDAISDGEWICPARRNARAIAANQPEAVWRYFWTHTDSSGPQQPFGAGHGVDRPYWFNNFFALADEYGSPFDPDASEQALGVQMRDYLVSFVDTGTPNGRANVAWPPYLASRDPYLQLDDAIAAGDGVKTAVCDFWDGL